MMMMMMMILIFQLVDKQKFFNQIVSHLTGKMTLFEIDQVVLSFLF